MILSALGIANAPQSARKYPHRACQPVSTPVVIKRVNQSQQMVSFRRMASQAKEIGAKSDSPPIQAIAAESGLKDCNSPILAAQRKKSFVCDPRPPAG